MNANWKNRLEQWAPEPPAKVWERMSEQLADDPQAPYAKKLHHFSAAPPAGAWDVIVTQLEPAATTPLIRLFPRNKIIRYSSVAASVLLAFFLFRQLRTQPQDGVSIENPVRQQTVLPLPQPETAVQENKTDLPEKFIADAPAANYVASSFTAVPAPQMDTDPLPTVQPVKASAGNIYELVPSAAHRVNDSYLERYIVLQVAEDAAVRLSKKLYNLFRCADMPDPANCSERLMAIRQRTALPSQLAGADFAGLLETIQQVDGNR